MAEICQPRSGDPGPSPSAQRAEPQVPPLRGTLASKAFCNNFHGLNWECIHLPQLTAAQELQIKAQMRLASLMEEKLVTRISVLSTLRAETGARAQTDDLGQRYGRASPRYYRKLVKQLVYGALTD